MWVPQHVAGLTTFVPDGPQYVAIERRRNDGLSSVFGGRHRAPLQHLSDIFHGGGMFLIGYLHRFYVSGNGERIAETVRHVAWSAKAAAHFRFKFREQRCKTADVGFKVRDRRCRV